MVLGVLLVRFTRGGWLVDRARTGNGCEIHVRISLPVG